MQVGTIEDRPGIPPSPAHLARLIREMKDEQVKVVVVEPWSDQKLAARVAAGGGREGWSSLARGRRASRARRLPRDHGGQRDARSPRRCGSAAMTADLLALMWVPFLMCLVLTGIHAYLGIHVIAREVVFVDIALAQIAALGATAAFLVGFELETWRVVRGRARLHDRWARCVLALTRSRASATSRRRR